MSTTSKIVLRALGVSAGILVLATCAEKREPLEPDARVNSAQTEARLERVIEPIELGVPNPAGLALSPRSGMLLLVTRAPGTPPSTATDIELITLDEERAGTVRIGAAVPDPVNMTFDGDANRLLIYDSSSDQLIEVRAGPDGSLDPQAIERIDAGSFAVQNPQGLTVDPTSGRLFILDTAGPRILRVEPDARLGFERPTITEIDLARTGLTALRGIALDRTNGHLHVLDPATQMLHELTETGQIVATRDLSEFGFRNVQGMTFGPSGDSTDDPAEMSLYLADSGMGGGGRSFAESGQIAELSFVDRVAASARLQATEIGTLIQTIDTWRFDPPSPDPSGITYLTSASTLLIADGEVDEMSIYKGANVFEMDPSGSLARTWTTTSFSNEPVGAAYNPNNNHLFISDDNKKTIWEIDPGRDGRFGTSDDIEVTSFSTSGFGAGDPEGIAYDHLQGAIFIADGVDAEVYRLSPGNNGVFGDGDDVVSHFDTDRLGLSDPEGIAYDSDFGHLYVIGEPVDVVFHVTTTGTLVRTIDVSAAGPDKPAGLAYGPSSVNPGQNSLWIVDRVVDNNSDPKENDGRAYEFALPGAPGNALPTVSITQPANGSSFTEGTSITFEGTASDPEDGNLTSSLVWTSSRDGSIGSGGTFSKSDLTVGTHTITASVTDNDGATGSNAITVTVDCNGCSTLQVRVAASSDDAEEDTSGDIDLTSSDLELILENDEQTVGMRFNALAIPRGATITTAYVQFQVDETSSDATSLTIQGQAADNAATFTSSSLDISSRSRTSSSVSWSPPPWTSTGAAGLDQRTSDISSIIQEIVNRAGWSSGNSLVIIITGTGKRVAESYDGTSSGAALLHVEYLEGGPTNNRPVATDDAGSVAEGGTLNVVAPGVLDNDSDPDGDPLTVTTTPVTGPSHGTLTLNADGSYSYTHDGGETTSDSFVYEVCDAGPLCDTGTVALTITPVNDPPVAADDGATLSTGETLNVPAPGVLSNDTDPEGGALTVNTTPVTAPTHGTLTLNANGSYSYTHDGGASTGDSFVYEVCDAGPLCDTATVNLTITVPNDPPVAGDDVGSVAEGGTLNVPAPGVLSNDSDPDGGALTVNTTPVTAPSHGTLTLNANGSYSYTHDGSETTSDSFVYEVCDAGPLCDTATVALTITPVNDPPVAADDAASVLNGQTLTVAAPGVLGNDSDPEGGALTVNTTPVTAPDHGALTLNANGSYTYTHDGTETTSDGFVYEVCDAGPLCDTATVNLTITVPASVHVLTPAGTDGYSTVGGRDNTRHLEVTVTLVDGNGAPVSGASLSANINGPTPGGGTGTTDSSGQVSFRITNAAPGTYTTTVTSVTAEGLTWDGITPSNSFTK